MPKKVVENIRTLSLPYFPVLAANNSQKVITKHFVNTALYLPAERVSLLMWLIYQSNADNSFKYEEKLVAKYSKSVKAAEKQYGSTGKIRVDFKVIRSVFKQLIETGHLLPTDEQAVFIINPMLTYHPKYMSRREYGKFMTEYSNLQQVSGHGMYFDNPLNRFVFQYRQIINSKISKKKK